MLEIVLTSKILRPSKIGGFRLKPFQRNGKSAPALRSHLSSIGGGTGGAAWA